MKFYLGWRTQQGCVVRVATKTSAWNLAKRLNIRNHSPCGFEWGYEGSGPAQLALAMLYDLTHDRPLTEALYQTFKREMIACIRSDTWSISEDRIRAWIAVQAVQSLEIADPK